MTGPYPAGPARRAAIVAAARGWIGTPYRHQASARGIGADCLGLVRGVWREVCGAEPEAPDPYLPDWSLADRRERLAEAAGRHLVAVAVTAAAPGDVLLFRWRAGLPAAHAGLLVTAGRFVHAMDGAAVLETALTPWWRRRLAHVFAFPEDPAP